MVYLLEVAQFAGALEVNDSSVENAQYLGLLAQPIVMKVVNGGPQIMTTALRLPSRPFWISGLRAMVAYLISDALDNFVRSSHPLTH